MEAPLRTLAVSSLALLTLTAACAHRQKATAPAAARPAAAEPAPPYADDPAVAGDPASKDDADGATSKEDAAAQALEQCQAAASLVDAGDTSGAIRSIDECYALMLALPEGDETFAQAKQDIRVLVADLVHRLYPQRTRSSAASLASWDLGLPIVDNEHVRYEIKSFTTAERNQMLEGYRRSGRYRKMILAKLEKAGLPSQLSWLPLVESAFMTNALSRSSALGLWQFISSTGLRYGLKRDAWVDERLDPEKATDAAIAYLIDLHSMFGDWPKALAAYNCGEALVQRLQERSAGKGYMDFWDLYAQLPEETRRYFPRLLAVLRIVEEPAKYGVTLPELDPEDANVAKVRIERPVKLEELERTLTLPAGTLARLNPELRQGATPKTAYALEVPATAADVVVAAADKLPAFEPREIDFVMHRVRSGDTLSTIARSYRTSVSVIMRLNGLKRSDRIHPGQRLRIPVRG